MSIFAKPSVALDDSRHFAVDNPESAGTVRGFQAQREVLGTFVGPSSGFSPPCLAPAVGTIARSHRARQGQRALDGVSPEPRADGTGIAREDLEPGLRVVEQEPPALPRS